MDKLLNILYKNTPDMYKDNYYHFLIDQYKIYVDMADKVSSRRDNINKFFLGIMTLLIGGIGYYFNNSKGNIYFPLIISVYGKVKIEHFGS